MCNGDRDIILRGNYIIIAIPNRPLTREVITDSPVKRTGLFADKSQIIPTNLDSIKNDTI
jgi:hypothetical protein